MIPTEIPPPLPAPCPECGCSLTWSYHFVGLESERTDVEDELAAEAAMNARVIAGARFKVIYDALAPGARG